MKQYVEKKKWTAFWFEGNQAWGWIESPEDWERIIIAYKGHMTEKELLKHSRRNDDNANYYFGLRSECNGNMTLGEFFDVHGMAWKPILKNKPK